MTWIRPGAGIGIALIISMGGLRAAQAGAPPELAPMTVTPTTVSNGTPFTVSGAGCFDPETQTGLGNTVYLEAPRLGYAYLENPEAKLGVVVEVEADGSWSVTTAPDTREGFFGPYKDFDTTLSGWCMFGDVLQPPAFRYQPVAMRYLGARAETTTTATTATTASTGPPSALPTGAAPATPVDAQATFTG